MMKMTSFRNLFILFALMLAITSDSFAQSQLVRFDSNLGKFDIELFDNTPLTRANFLSYVDAGDYDGVFMNRLAPGFVIQGGGFTVVDGNFDIVTRRASVQNEPFNSNLRGTVSLAKLGDAPNSGTNNFFFNLSDDNIGFPAFLDDQNGGFTAFGQIVGDGLDVVDEIASLTPLNLGPALNQIYEFPPQATTFSSVPIINPGPIVAPTDFVVFSTVTRVDNPLGDLDGSGAISGPDIDLLCAAYGSAPAGDIDLDLDSDGVVGDSDRDRLVERIAGTRLGDVNFDGLVNVLGDAFVLVANLGTVSGATYAQGDFNCDGIVDVLGDAFILVSNLGFDASSTP